MADMMTFPDTVEEFMEQYKMVDKEEVYSNGTEYVPIYRMNQWFDHIKAQRSDSDLIRREDAIKMLCNSCKGIGTPKYCEYESRCASLSVLKHTPAVEPRERVVAKICFDEDKLREISKEAVRRLLEENRLIERRCGKWVNAHGAPIQDGYSLYCSECGLWSEYRTDFCGHCGADMRGKDNEQ